MCLCLQCLGSPSVFHSEAMEAPRDYQENWGSKKEKEMHQEDRDLAW